MILISPLVYHQLRKLINLKTVMKKINLFKNFLNKKIIRNFCKNPEIDPKV